MNGKEAVISYLRKYCKNEEQRGWLIAMTKAVEMKLELAEVLNALKEERPLEKGSRFMKALEAALAKDFAQA